MDFPSHSTELLEWHLQKDNIFFHVLLSLLATTTVTPKCKNVIKLIQCKVGKFCELWDKGFFTNNFDRLRSTKRKHYRFIFKRNLIQISDRTPAILLRVIPQSLLIFDTDSFVTQPNKHTPILAFTQDYHYIDQDTWRSRLKYQLAQNNQCSSTRRARQ
jgi:hypothetical protein